MQRSAWRHPQTAESSAESRLDPFICLVDNSVQHWPFCAELLLFPLRKAMLLLKKKHYQEQLLDKTDNQISNLERMVSEHRVLHTWGRTRRGCFGVCRTAPQVPAGL